MIDKLKRSEKEPELVDLGLPSGNLWMKCNLGAKTETDFGLFYQWGGLEGCCLDDKKDPRNGTFKNHPFIENDKLNLEYVKKNKYKWVYKNNILKPEYDIITQTYGRNYRLPTELDFLELKNNTTGEYILDDKVKGVILKSNINGNTIFVPFVCKVISNFGHLWSSRFIPISNTCAYVFTVYGNTDKKDFNVFVKDRATLSMRTNIRGIKINE